MSGGDDRRRTIPRETEDDEERAKRQRTEKKTELEMEVSSVAKINDRRRIPDLRRVGWELENIIHREAAMFCACELRPRVIRTRCTKRNQLESTWDLCGAQGAQGLGYVCEFVGSIADDPMKKNIQNSTGCNATIIRGSVTGQSISDVDNICRRLQRAMKETGLLNSQDIDRVVEDSLDEEGEEMVADDVKKGSIPIRLVNQAKTEEQKYIEKMKVLDVVDRKEASGSKVIRTKWVVTNKGTPEKPNVRARWVAQEYKWMDGPDCEHYAPTPGLDLVKGVLGHAAAAGKSKDHVVAVVDVRRAYFYAEPLPKTFVELPDYFDIDTRTRCCGRLRRVPVRNKTSCKVVAT